MKFRLKTTLCMVCLVSLLFGAGSCALISFSFQNALEREQAAARSAYALLVRTLQLVETVEVWSQPQDVVQVLQQLSAQGNKSWSALSLETEQEFLSARTPTQRSSSCPPKATSPGRPSPWKQSRSFSPKEVYRMAS